MTSTLSTVPGGSNTDTSENADTESLKTNSPPDALRVGILTVSDRCSQQKVPDLSGDIITVVSGLNHWKIVERKCVEDDEQKISSTLTEWCDTLILDLILTTGGTGLGRRDVTPEATKAILDKETPGITTALIAESLKITPMAMLSRLVTGIRKSTLIINFPGSPKACAQCIEIVKPVLKHAIDLLRNSDQVNQLHDKTNKLESKVNVSQVARRNRQSPYELITVDEAQCRILKFIHEMPVMKKNLKDALGFVVAEDIRAVEPFPPFRASIKDGYAVITADGIGSRKVICSSLAGFETHDDILKSGECVRITTGAPIPKGSDAVVQVEDTVVLSESERGEIENIVEILKPPRLGQDIREIGSDIKKGEVIVCKGTILTPAALGVLATAGCCEIPVMKKPRVAVVSTGNEIQNPNETLQPGKIRDSNKTTLLALLEENGYSACDCGIVPDEPNILLNTIYNTLQNVDVLITTGGVSMGERDLIADVLLEDLNAQLLFGRLKMKPGKPTKVFSLPWKDGPKYVFALPGNPVSAAVTCHLFVFPALRAMSGWKKPLPMLIKVKVPVDIKLDERYEYARASLIWNEGEDIPSASLTGNQISSRLMNLIEADCLLHLPAATPSMKVLQAGTIVKAQLINKNLMRTVDASQ